MTKTAANDLRPCWRCDEITLWQARDGVAHCATCEPARAAWLIAERLRATAVPPSQLRRAMRFILLELKGAESINARAVIDAATRAGIAPATLVRAGVVELRRTMNLRSAAQTTDEYSTDDTAP